MLEPKDVRVGNWVLKLTGRDLNSKSFFEYKAIALDEYYFTFAKMCFPIKLSPAVLGKCGFKHEFGDWYKNLDVEDLEGGSPFLRFKQETGCWYLKDMKIPAQPLYLHQLQNLYYALSGQELNIQLGNFENIDIIGPIGFFVKPFKKRSVTRELL